MQLIQNIWLRLSDLFKAVHVLAKSHTAKHIAGMFLSSTLSKAGEKGLRLMGKV